MSKSIRRAKKPRDFNRNCQYGVSTHGIAEKQASASIFRVSCRVEKKLCELWKELKECEGLNVEQKLYIAEKIEQKLFDIGNLVDALVRLEIELERKMA